MSTSKECPKYKREAELALIKETHKIPYWKAVELLEGKSKDYSNVVKKNVYANTAEKPATHNNNLETRLTQMLEVSNKVWQERLSQIQESVSALATGLQSIITAVKKGKSESGLELSDLKVPLLPVYSTPTNEYIAASLPKEHSPELSNNDMDTDSTSSSDSQEDDDDAKNNALDVETSSKKLKTAEHFIKKNRSTKSKPKGKKHRKK